MKFMQAFTYNDNYLKYFYKKTPGINQLTFSGLIRLLVQDGYAASHVIAPIIGGHGYEPVLVISNDCISQAKWLNEIGISGPKSQLNLIETLTVQIEYYKPDILYLNDTIRLDSKFIKSLKWRPKLVLGWRASSIPAETDWSEFDIIFTNVPGIFEEAKRHGAKNVEFLMPGFPKFISEAVKNEPKENDIVFTGQIFPGLHKERMLDLLELCKAPLSVRGEFSIGMFIESAEKENLPVGINLYDQGALYGLDMHRAMKNGRIVLNPIGDPLFGSNDHVNMRHFEITGTGSFMLTNSHSKISDYFRVGYEIETYKSRSELLDKIYYYLQNEKEREEIARNGQLKCLNEHSMEGRVDQLDKYIRKYLPGGNVNKGGFLKTASANRHNDTAFAHDGAVTSPITGSTDVSLVRTIPASFIISGYKQYNVNTDKYFRGLSEISLYKCNKTGLEFFHPGDLEGDSEFYGLLQNIPWYYMEDKWEFDVAIKLIRAGNRVLEVGSGRGAFVKKLLKNNIDAVGLELNSEAARNCQKNGLPVYPQLVADHSKVNGARYDVVCSFQVLEHISNIREFILDCISCLNENGRLIFSVPNHSSFLKDDKENIFDLPPHHLSYWSEETLTRVAEYFGMEVKSMHVEPLADYHFEHYLNIYKRNHTSHEVEEMRRDIYEGRKFIKGHTVLVELVRKGMDGTVKPNKPDLGQRAPEPVGNALNAYLNLINKFDAHKNIPFTELLNLGCGERYHSAWINIDINSNSDKVIKYDLSKPLPFETGTIDAVYHSHVLEHFSKAKAVDFIGECFRVLRKDGILRVVVPDLEQIAVLYLDLLKKSLAGDNEAREKYECIMLEMYDQTVRTIPGGEMYRYWRQKEVPAEKFIIERLGSEAKNAMEYIKAKGNYLNKNEMFEETDPYRLGQFRLSGEIHQWMYDRYSLRKLLQEAGFSDIKVCRADESGIPDFNSYLLDVEPDGSIRKPDSLFMEARK